MFPCCRDAIVQMNSLDVSPFAEYMIRNSFCDSSSCRNHIQFIMVSQLQLFTKSLSSNILQTALLVLKSFEIDEDAAENGETRNPTYNMFFI